MLADASDSKSRRSYRTFDTTNNQNKKLFTARQVPIAANKLMNNHVNLFVVTCGFEENVIVELESGSPH